MSAEPPPASRAPRIALVGATAAAIPPAAQGFRQEFPEAELWNILDDRLISEAIAAGAVTRQLHDRMSRLIGYAVEAGASGVLLTCSMYGPVAHELAKTVSVPLHASDDAAFEMAGESGFQKIALLSSLPVPLADAEARFAQFLHGRGMSPRVESVLVAGAFEASVAGDADALARSLAQAVHALESKPDAVLLAQYSIAPAADLLGGIVRLPVLSGPSRAAAKMRTAVLGSSA